MFEEQKKEQLMPHYLPVPERIYWKQLRLTFW